MYDRDKTISREWYDPVGWAGLDKVPTRTEELDVILKRQADIEARCVSLRSEIQEKSSRLKSLGMEAEATRDRSHLRKLHEAQTRRIEELSKEVDTLRGKLSDDEVLYESLGDHAERLRNGERPPARAHIARAARPVSEAETRAGRVAQLWASISVAVVLMALVGIFVYQSQQLLSALVFAIALFAFVEAGFRKRLTRFIGSANVGLAVVGALVLLQHFFWQIIVLTVVAVGNKQALSKNTHVPSMTGGVTSPQGAVDWFRKHIDGDHNFGSSACFQRGVDHLIVHFRSILPMIDQLSSVKSALYRARHALAARLADTLSSLTTVASR
jgi:hypothetical protein